MTDEDGFTLVEILLIVAIIGILTTMAVPALSRARVAAVEASTIATLRSLVTAQATFAANCGSGFFAPTILSLSSGTGASAFIGPEFRTDVVDRFGYRFRFTAGTVAAKAPTTCNGVAAGQTVGSYFIAADPLQAGPGMGVRHFGTGPGTTIYQSTAIISAYYTGTPSLPAIPVQ
jgi:type IV pilus assembly protein PilA